MPPDSASSLERLWPGLVGELIADGAAIVGRDRRRAAAISRRSSRSVTLQATRSFFEYHLRRRLPAAGKITHLAGLDAVGLLAAGPRCRGVWVISRSRGAAARTVPADLVVDAMGVGSRLICWLAETWHASVPIERSETAGHYLSRRYRLPSWTPAAARGGLSPDRRHRWMIMAVEDGDHILTIGGLDRGVRPVDLDRFDALVRTVPAPEVAAAVRHGRATAGPSSRTRFPFQRRRFDRALALPDGLLALGGSLDSTDPLHGMALSAAVSQADLLDRVLHGIEDPDRSGRSCLSGRYFKAAFGDDMR